MSENMFLNFADVEVPTSNHMEPGQYRTKVSKVVLENVTSKQTQITKPVLKITFTTKDDKSYTESFYLKGETPDKTKKALGRLQYLHEAVLGTKLSESFTDYSDIQTYFEKKLMGKGAPVINLLITGEEQEDGRVYSRLGFADFIFGGSDKDFVEEVFEPGTEAYKKAVKKKKSTPAGMGVLGTSAPVLNPINGQAKAAPWEQD